MVWKKDANQDTDDEKMSRINSAGIINITIENLWRESYSAMANGKLSLWNRKLDAIWLILGGDVNPNDSKEKEFDSLDEKLHKLGSLSHQTKGFAKVNESSQNNIAKQYLILRKKSLFLRRLQNGQGKGTAYSDGDEYDFD